MSTDQRPNILILCVDQWDANMQLPAAVHLPALERLASRGVSFGDQYCTFPICTPSRSTMWTGVHAVHTNLWDNTNFSFITELSTQLPTLGHMLRDAGYYTAFKGKWHLSDVPASEDALERYGFADYQQWRDMFGAPLQGAQLDASITFETVDWLQHTAPGLDQPWLLVCSLVNPHDVMWMATDPSQVPDQNGITAHTQTTVQELSWFQQDWEPELPESFEDDLSTQPPAIAHYRDYVDVNYGHIPADRLDLWRKHRNYLINCMRLADHDFTRVLDALDRLDLWKDTIVIFTGDHGEMNAAHRLRQKGPVSFDEANQVALTVCVPGGRQGERTDAVGSQLDLVPTLLDLAGVSADDIHGRYNLRGRSLRPVLEDPASPGPRGSVHAPGDGALVLWDSLHSLDMEWTKSGAMVELTDNSVGGPSLTAAQKKDQLLDVGRTYGAPDFSKRNVFRFVVDGQYKLVRWFSPDSYGNPATVDELYAGSDVGLYDLVADPGEQDNLARRDDPRFDAALVQRMLDKLHALVAHEIGDDVAPYSLDMFGTREVKYAKG